MKKINKYDIKIPELGDRPDITVVSNAINNIGDAAASAIESMECSVQSKEMRLTSLSRKFKRSGYYDGMMVAFAAPRRIRPGEVTSLAIDDLPQQPLTVGFVINSGEVAMCVYNNGRFKAVSSGMNKQDVEDDGLKTEDKTIVGAINEVRASLVDVASEEEMVTLVGKYKGV